MGFYEEGISLINFRSKIASLAKIKRPWPRRITVYPRWWVVDGSLPSLDGFWFQHVRERQGIITVTSLSLAPWSPFISPIVATGWNRQKQCESIGRVQRSWTTDGFTRKPICMYNLYIYIQPKNYGSWNTNIIIDIYIYRVMCIPPHSTSSGTNRISTSLPKKKHSPTSQSLVRQHHETRCPPLFRPSFKLKSLENSGRRMRRVEGGWSIHRQPW